MEPYQKFAWRKNSRQQIQMDEQHIQFVFRRFSHSLMSIYTPSLVIQIIYTYILIAVHRTTSFSKFSKTVTTMQRRGAAGRRGGANKCEKIVFKKFKNRSTSSHASLHWFITNPQTCLLRTKPKLFLLTFKAFKMLQVKVPICFNEIGLHKTAIVELFILWNLRIMRINVKFPVYFYQDDSTLQK